MPKTDAFFAPEESVHSGHFQALRTGRENLTFSMLNSSKPTYSSTKMSPLFTPPMSARKPSEEIRTKHKEAIRQLHKFAKIGLQPIEGYYNLGDSTVRKILSYDIPKRARPTHTGRPRESLDAQEVQNVITYIFTDYATRELN